MEPKRKDKRDAEERESLLRNLDNLGGLFVFEVVHAKLSNLPSVEEQRFALKIQLNFRQKVTGVKYARTS